MGSSIPFNEQYFVEKHRNNIFQWMIFIIGLGFMFLHGIFFFWIPICVRRHRMINRNSFRRYLKIINSWELLNEVFEVEIPLIGKKFLQPSLLLISGVHFAINVIFLVIQTKDLDYEPRYYVIGKRLGRLAVGNFLLLMLCVTRNNSLHYCTGLSFENLEFYHIWLGRFSWALITVHTGLTIYYWLSLNFIVMIQIPPQIFGMMAYGAFTLLTWTSLKFLRKLAYDFFLVQHKFLSAFMLFFAFLHSPPGRAGILVAVHLLVIDRIISIIGSLIRRTMTRSKGDAYFNNVNAYTVRVVIPLSELKVKSQKCKELYSKNMNTWRAGQHIFLNVGKVSRTQYHPFTISTLSDSGNMVLLIKVKKGFTKKLWKKINKLEHETGEKTHQLKCSILGPFGAIYEPLESFNTVTLLSAGFGSSFTFPIALDLIDKIIKNNNQKKTDISKIHIVCVLKKYEELLIFNDVYCKMKPHIDDLMVVFDLYQTTSNINEFEPCTNVEQANSKTYKHDESFSYSTSSSSTSKSLSDELTNVNLYYGRPNLGDIIAQEVEVLASESERNSIAILGCGPSLFTEKIKKDCQNIRKSSNSPEIYFCGEGF